MGEFMESTFGASSIGQIHLTGADDDYLGEKVIDLMVDDGSETTSVQLDAYHLTELLRALRRGEKWLGEQAKDQKR